MSQELKQKTIDVLTKEALRMYSVHNDNLSFRNLRSPTEKEKTFVSVHYKNQQLGVMQFYAVKPGEIIQPNAGGAKDQPDSDRHTGVFPLFTMVDPDNTYLIASSLKMSNFPTKPGRFIGMTAEDLEESMGDPLRTEIHARPTLLQPTIGYNLKSKVNLQGIQMVGMVGIQDPVLALEASKTWHNPWKQ